MKGLQRLAANFNALMNVAADSFGSSPRRAEPGDGVKRARARLAAYRKAQADRLKDGMGEVVTRQQSRAEDRRLGKMPIGVSQARWHSMKGFPAIKPRWRSA